MEIKTAKVSDAEEILTLQKLAYKSEAELHDDFNIPPLTQTLEELVSGFEIKTILKIEYKGKIIASGQSYLTGNFCHIGRMVVHPDFQGQGIGAALMSALEGVFPDSPEYEIFTGEKSSRNLGMYERRGYHRFKTVKLGKTNVIFLHRKNC